MEPINIPGPATTSFYESYRRPLSYLRLRPIIAIAASVVIMLLAGFVGGYFLANSNSKFFADSSNDVITPAASSLSEDRVVEIVREQMKSIEVSDQYLAQLQEIERSVNSMKKDIQSNSSLSDEKLGELLARLEQSNLNKMNEYFNTANLQQKEQLKFAMTQFYELLQEQRAEDLALISASLMELQQSQTVQKYETNEAIASLFSSLRTSKE